MTPEPHDPLPRPPDAPPEPAGGPGNVPVLLGLFIVWQLVFLVGSNFLGLLKNLEDKLPADKLGKVAKHLSIDMANHEGHLNEVYKIFSRYAEMTGQYQAWSLFAPGVTRNLTFVAVELRWDETPAAALPRGLAPLAADGPLQAVVLHAAAGTAAPSRPAPKPVLLLSDNEPRDVHSFLRWGQFRTRKYENNLELMLRVVKDDDDPETEAQAHVRWRKTIRKHVAKEWDTMQAYFRWRLKAFARAHLADPPPTQVILVARRYRAHSPGEKAPWDWDAPEQVPLARWQLTRPADARHLPVEAYNPVTKRFEFVERD